MDPRRKIDEKYDRISSGQVPFVDTSTEIVLQPQSLGKPVEREILVIRIDKNTLKTYSLLAAVVVATILVGVLAA